MDINKLAELVKSTRDIIFDRSAADSVTEKGPADFVTRVDTGVQEYLRGKLSELYPEVQFMGEESNNSNIDFSRPVWILDPIDGTTNLIHNYQMSAVSLALAENGKPVLGIVYNPFHDEIFTAEKGGGAFLNGKRIYASSAKAMADSLIAVGTSPYEKNLAERNFGIFRRIFDASQDIRRSGSAALDLCYTAAGRIDGYCEAHLKPWDFAAGSIILSEAGGRVSNYSGEDVDFTHNSDIIAANPFVFKELCALIQSELTGKISLKKLWGHFLTITNHRHKVIAGCFRAGIGFQGLFHDLSKYSPTEFLQGARYYQGTRSPNDYERELRGYSKAWLHHQGRNRHHHEYWHDYSRATHKQAPVKMPVKYVVENFCDRIAASKVYMGADYDDSKPLDYFKRSGAAAVMHPDTAALLEGLLTMLSERGEDEAFRYLRALDKRG